MSDAAIEPGSFRDRTARVFYLDGHVYRGLDRSALRNWEALEATQFFRRFSGAGALVATTRRDLPSMSPAVRDSWEAVLEHERLPFVSYPYEWAFSMLRDAALLQLDLVLAALDEDFSLKDASAYNVQWKGAKPVFVDIGSFCVRSAGEPWVGYRQFCQMFLYPLLLQAYRDVAFQPLMRGSLEGIAAGACLNLLSGRDLFRRGVFTHVYLQARAQSAYAGTNRDIRAELSSAGFDKAIIKANATRLRKLVEGLVWSPKPSTWSEYQHCGHYEEADRQRKLEFVESAARRRRWNLVWDVGCNVGAFSRVAAKHANYVVAMDADALAIERLYNSIKQEPSGNVLPLVVDVTDPPPNLGWRNQERKRLEERGRPDLVLALALVHHVVIGANVPLGEFIGWLRDLGGSLLIEFVNRRDPMVMTLLKNKDDHYSDYDEDVFERELASRYRVVSRETLGSGTRTLYFAEPR